MTSEKTIERSVDSLQRIYAIIVGFAIGEGIRRLFLNSSGGLEFHQQHLPEFLTFIFTAVPFVHGMNRHLDKTLTTIQEQNRRGLFIIIVFDFAVFLIESCVLALLAISVMSDVSFFWLWILLLTIDIVWTFITWPITREAVWQWAVVNIAAIIASIAVLNFVADLQVKVVVLTAIAILRTVLDYMSAWEFYFPKHIIKTAD